MLEKIKSIMLFAGIDSSEYQKVSAKIHKSNCTMVTVFSSFAASLIAIVFVLTFFIEGIKQNRIIYGLGLIISLVLINLSLSIAKKYAWVATLLVHISFSIFFIYGILIGTIADPTQKTVTFMVMLVLMPVVFIERPVRTASTVSFYVILFILLCFRYKSPNVLSVDIMDSIIFGILGIASGIVLSHIKIKSYVLECQLQESSRTDSLTKMNNRNLYESELETIPNSCKSSLACVYIDVNGLHDLNNREGHESGDAMLKFIAEQIKTHLGERYSYRIGGDEFVAFVLDPDENSIRQNLERITTTVEDRGYHAAIGLEITEIPHLNMNNLVSSAESKMYQNKEQFYETCTIRQGQRSRR